MTSHDLLRFGVIDEVVAEPLEEPHRDHREAAANLKSFLIHALRGLADLPGEELLQRRYEKFRRMGQFLEGPPSLNGQPESPGEMEQPDDR